MKSSLFKDVKTMVGFATATLSSIVAVILAVNSSSYWIPFVVITIIIQFLSVKRADYLYRENKALE